MSDKTKPPPGYTINYGGAAGGELDESAEGWFYIPSAKSSVFYKTRRQAIKAAWNEYSRCL